MQAVKGANNSRQGGQQASNSFPFFSNDLGQGGSSTVGEVKTRTNTFCSFQFSIFSSTIWIDLLVVFIFSCFRSTYRQFSIVFKWVMTRGFDQTMGVSFPYISLTIYQSNAQQGTNMNLVNRNRSTVSDMASLKANLFTFL